MFENGILGFIWYLFIIYIYVMAFWVFVQIIADIFRRENLSGAGKAGWLLLIMLVPFLGILIYMIARPKNTEQDQRIIAEARAMQARISGGSSVDDIAKAKELLDSGVLSQAEFESIKAKALA